MILFNKLYVDLNLLSIFYIEIKKIVGIGNSNKIYKKFGISKFNGHLFILILLKKKFEFENFIKKNFLISYGLKYKNSENIKYKCIKKIYQGIRHKLGLSVRGQRTHSNCKTQKFNKLPLKITRVKIKKKIKKKVRKKKI